MKWSSRTGVDFSGPGGARDGRPARVTVPCPVTPAGLTGPVQVLSLSPGEC
ncbi:hypothetical protein P376_0836 [Streptomyces sp. HCCB10043]|nr:hypothetical protein P376_0836 [Streptomyces sp. HCCB10043]EWS93461.1 hypothetical protein SSIG_04055 [Streptomyces filamentosus NRRL 11379]